MNKFKSDNAGTLYSIMEKNSNSATDSKSSKKTSKKTKKSQAEKTKNIDLKNCFG